MIAEWREVAPPFRVPAASRRPLLLALGWALLLAGCGLFSTELDEFPVADLSPTSGVLAVGGADTVRLLYTVQWPGRQGGGRVVIPVDLVVAPADDRFGVSVARPNLGRTSVAFETSEIKVWLNDAVSPPAPADYEMRVEARVSGSELLSSLGFEGFRLTVVAANTFVLQPPSPFDLIRGQPTALSLGILRPPGFTAPVQLSLTPQAGFTATFSPNPAPGSESSMQLTADASVAAGEYTLRVSGAGGGFTATRSFIARVSDPSYGVTLRPPSMRMAPGGNATIQVDVSGGTFRPATLSAPAAPANTVFAFSPNPTSGVSTLTVSAGLLAVPGSYTVPIVGTFADGGTGSALLALTISPPAGWVQMFRDTTVHFAMAIDTLSGIGFAVGDAFPGVSRRSTDGGATWIKGPTIIDTPTPIIYDVSILGSRLVAVGYAGVGYYSSDGAVSWDRAGTGTGRSLYGVAFRSIGVGVAVGDGVILSTIDGGVFWGTSSQVTTSDFFLDVDYGGNSAFAVGMNGLIMRSTVGQDDWAPLNSGTTADLNGVSFADSNNGIAVGTGGTILVTTDGGATWSDRSIPGVTAPLYRVAMLNATTATVGGLNRLHQTTDGGMSWTQDASQLPLFARVWAIHLFADNTGIVLVQNSVLGGVSTFLRR